MKTYGKYVAMAVVAVLGIYSFYLSASAWGRFASITDGMSFYLEQPLGVSEAFEVEQTIEEEREEYAAEESDSEAKQMPKFCIWGQKDQQMLTNEDLFRSTQADIILLCGSPELLFEDCRIPAEKDSQGCLIDEGTSWELFGSTNVEGQEISYQGKSYTVRKVIPGEEKIFALQICGLVERKAAKDGLPSEGEASKDMRPDGAEEDVVLNRITMQKPEEKSQQDMALMWGRYGLSVTILDMELLGGIGGFCVLLLPAASCIYFLVYLFRQCRQQKHPVFRAVAAVLGLILAVSFFVILKSRINIPDDYIPTKWSDFSFWTELWKGRQEAVRQLVQIPKTALDTVWMEAFGRTLFYGLLAQISAAGFLIMAKCKSQAKM